MALDDRTQDNPGYVSDDPGQAGFDEPEQPLNQDHQRPAAPPDVTDPAFPADHPETDTDLDADEVYDAGTKAASGVGEQDATPEANERDERRIA